MCFNLCGILLENMQVSEQSILNYRGPSQSYYCNKLIAENSQDDEHIRNLGQNGKSTLVFNI